MNITVLGDGGWGTSLAIKLHNNGHAVRLWGAFPDYTIAFNTKRENVKFLPGVKIPDGIDITSDAERASAGAELFVVVVPSKHVRSVMKRFKEFDLLKAKIVSATKGIEEETLLRVSEVIRDVLGNVRLAVLSGPTIAFEVARSMPATIVSASKDVRLAKEVQSLFISDSFRVYASRDIVGVELGGSLKNIIAIASGVADGLRLGANSKAAILTRGMQEITRLGLRMGAKRETFSGLSCMGDLITTCMSKHSRNRWLGEEIGKGRMPKEIMGSTEMAIEGFVTTGSARSLGKKYRVDMPITEEIYEILYNNKDPKAAVKSLMTRTPKDEIY
ncbi:MAG: NAD(P)H-dependent glycerol-3-phosphate dehydrogenase [Candidatus Omnitrophota bacterium]